MAFSTSYLAGGELDKNKLTDIVNEVKKVDWIGGILGFPTLTQPYNTMVMLNVPAMQGIYETEWVSPEYDVEILALTVTCSGYGELDHYNILCNDRMWLENWYCSERKEGLFLGTSTFVYHLSPKSKIKLQFNNESGTHKLVWFGIRMLRGAEDSNNIEEGGNNNE